MQSKRLPSLGSLSFAHCSSISSTILPSRCANESSLSWNDNNQHLPDTQKTQKTFSNRHQPSTCLVAEINQALRRVLLEDRCAKRLRFREVAEWLPKISEPILHGNSKLVSTKITSSLSWYVQFHRSTWFFVTSTRIHTTGVSWQPDNEAAPQGYPLPPCPTHTPQPTPPQPPHGVPL